MKTLKFFRSGHKVADNVGALRSGGHRYSSVRKLTTAKLKNKRTVFIHQPPFCKTHCCVSGRCKNKIYEHSNTTANGRRFVKT